MERRCQARSGGRIEYMCIHSITATSKCNISVSHGRGINFRDIPSGLVIRIKYLNILSSRNLQCQATDYVRVGHLSDGKNSVSRPGPRPVSTSKTVVQ